MKDLNYKINKKNIKCGNNKLKMLFNNNWSNWSKIFNTQNNNQRQLKKTKKKLIF